MVKVDFCATDERIECVAEGLIGLIPVGAFLAFGFYSYRETRARSAYVRQKYTFRHLSKIILSSVLAVVSLMFSIIYPIVEKEMSLKTELTWVVSSFLWIFNAFLIRGEYKSLGFTTNYLRYAWITMFVCQTALLIFAAVGVNNDEFGKVAAIYIVNEIVLLAIIIVGFSYSDDYPPNRVSEAYESVMSGSSVIDVGDDHFRNLASPLDRSVKSRDTDSFRPFTESLEGDLKEVSKSRNGSIMRGVGDADSFKGDDRSLLTREKTRIVPSGTSLQVNLREDVRLIEKIDVKRYEEIIRKDKKTNVYVIEFVIKGQQFTTKRSYSEFVSLRKDVKKEKTGMKLPKIPPKKAIGKSKDEESLGIRLDAFDKLLKMLVQEKVGFTQLGEFLQPVAILPHYGKGQKKAEDVKPRSNTMQLPSQGKPDPNKEVKTKVLDNNSGFKNYEKSNIIPDYTRDGNRSQSLMGSSKYYTVEINDTIEEEGSTFYKIKIREKETGVEKLITKRYNEFKNFHETLRKNLSSGEKKLLPDLPYKENVKGFSWKDDGRVVEYRKVALKTYLQNIINNPMLQTNQIVKSFIMYNNI